MIRYVWDFVLIEMLNLHSGMEKKSLKNKVLNRFTLTVMILIVVDQVAKLFFQQFTGNEYVIIENFISIKPFLHTNFYYTDLLNISVGRIIKLLIAVFAMYFTIAVFGYLKDICNNFRLLNF